MKPNENKNLDPSKEIDRKFKLFFLQIKKLD